MADVASPMLSEHQAPEQDAKEKADVYEPTPAERKAIRLVDKVLEKNKKHRAMYDTHWLDYYRIFRGRQWKENRPSYRHSEVVNLVFRSIQSLVPIQVDTRPRFEFLPQEPADMEVAEIINEVAEADWIRNNWGEQLLEVVYDSNILSTGLSSMEGEPDKITYRSRDPFYCYPDPEARNTDRGSDCHSFVYAEPRDIRWVKRKWPKKAKFIKPDVEHLIQNEKAQDDVRFRSPADRNMVMEGTMPADPSNKELCLVKELWLSPEACYDDYDEEKKEVLDPATGEPVVSADGQPQYEYIQKAKYPKGRKIVTCNGVLLEDDHNPYDDGENPFDRYPNYVLPREFWGMSEVEQLKGPQRMFNKVWSFALDVLTLMGNPIWSIPTSSGIDPDTLTNRPGLNVEWDGDKEPKRIEGVGLQPYVFQMTDRLVEWFDSIAGSQDITRGVQPTGITAASALDTLQEAAHTRIRQKARNLDFYLQSTGQKYLSRVFQFYSAPKVIRLTGKDQAAAYFKMHVTDYEREDGSQGKQLTVTPYTEAGLEDVSGMKSFKIKGHFDVRVVTGSSLPFAKAEKEQKLLNLFDRGIVDAEEVLKGTEYPNWEGVLARVEEKKALEAQAQAQAQPA
jgi:hypothetical protein